jgi:hypothetical protein
MQSVNFPAMASGFGTCCSVAFQRKVLTMKSKVVNCVMTYTTVTPLTVVRIMVEPGVPPNAGLFFSVE